MKNIAVVLAGGSGKRMGLPTPKQFVEIAGRAVIEYSIGTFNDHSAIDEVAVVVHPDWRQELQIIIGRNRWDKLKKVIDGGSERYMSTLNAVMAYIDYPDDSPSGSKGETTYVQSGVNLLLHDAARPLVSADIIDRVVSSLQHHEAVGVAVPSTDTVWEVHPDISAQYSEFSAQSRIPRFVARIPERRLMWRAQTPQAFRLPLIRDAYQRALQDPQFQVTDDCGVVRKYMPSTKIAVVEGDERNFKITVSSDLERAKALVSNS